MAFNLSAVLKFSTTGVESNIDKASRSVKKLQKNFETAARRAKNVGRGLRNVALAGTLVAGGMVKVIGSYMEFQKQMDSVRAKMRPTKDDFIAMTNLAKELGAKTIFTGKQAAEGLEFLALAGFNAKEAMGVLPSILNTAAAGALDLGAASDIITDSMSAMSPVMTKFGSKQKQAIALADMMALAQAKTNTNIEQLGQAIVFGGGAMANMGIPLNQIIASMGALADAGIKGSSGGTALVNMMGKLAKVSSKGKKHLEDMGISMDDIQTKGKGGKIVLKDMASIMEVFSNALAKNPNMLEKAGVATELFGRRGQRAFFALQNKGGKALRLLFGQLENSSKMMGKDGKVVGASAAMAEIMTDNIFGAWESFKSATSGIQINLGEMMSRFFDIKGSLQSITAPLAKFSLALQNVMTPTDQLSDSAKRLLKTPIGQFAIGVAEGFKEVKSTVIELVKEFRNMIGVADGGKDTFKDMGKLVVKLVVGLALVGPPLLVIGAALLFLTPIVIGVISLFGIFTTAISSLVTVMGIMKQAVIIQFGFMRKMAQFLRLDVLWTKISATAKKAWTLTVTLAGNALSFLRGKIMATSLAQKLSAFWTNAVSVATKGYMLATTLMGSGLTFLMGKIMATQIAQKLAAFWTTAVTAAQWLWNAALTANPIGLVIVGIGALIAGGIALWKNWDTVTKKVKEVWEGLGNWRIVIIALTGPIGWLITAGVLIAKNWDKVSSVLSKAWGWVKKMSSSAVGKVLNFVGLGGDKVETKPDTKSAKVFNIAQERANRGISNKRDDELLLTGDRPEGLGSPSEQLNREHLAVTQLSASPPNINVSPASAPNINQELNFEVINTFDGDTIHTSIKKKQRAEKLQSGDQLSDVVMERGQQVSYGS